MNQRKQVTVLFMSLSLLMLSLPGFAAPTVPPACYACDNFFGPYECKTGSVFGATSCTASQNTCTVSGNCRDSASGSTSSQVSQGIILEVAEANPRVAATLWTLASDGMIEAEGQVFWHNSEVSSDDVRAMINGDDVRLEQTPGDAVVFHYSIDRDPKTGAVSLVIVPQRASDLDPEFSAFVLDLKADADSGSYAAGGWSLF